ncbi:MAG: XrtA system polysaccharide deacetylase [Gammaproteobacteria bacterium]
MNFTPRPVEQSDVDCHLNAMTIDVEDYFQVSAFNDNISLEEWSQHNCRVENNMDRMLQLFSDNDVKATFFTLGWIAEKYPDIVKKIVANGHELASHGRNHTRVFDQTPEQFSADIIHTKNLLEDIGGVEVKGYRAASFSIDDRNLWAYDCLSQAGYQYSSSIYPVEHDHYGMPDAPRFSFFANDAGLVEVPISTVQWLNRLWPSGGGGYFRFFPYAISKRLIQTVNEKEQRSAIFYLHPWEIDPEQPKQDNLPMKTKFRHYVNLKHTYKRLEKLSKDFRWDRMDRVFSI